jgi:hypothetical protein
MQAYIDCPMVHTFLTNPSEASRLYPRVDKASLIGFRTAAHSGDADDAGADADADADGDGDGDGDAGADGDADSDGDGDAGAGGDTDGDGDGDADGDADADKSPALDAVVVKRPPLTGMIWQAPYAGQLLLRSITCWPFDHPVPENMLGRRVVVIQSTKRHLFERLGSTLVEELPVPVPKNSLVLGSVIIVSSRMTTPAELKTMQATHCLKHPSKAPRGWVWTFGQPRSIVPVSVNCGTSKDWLSTGIKPQWMLNLVHDGDSDNGPPLLINADADDEPSNPKPGEPLPFRVMSPLRLARTLRDVISSLLECVARIVHRSPTNMDTKGWSMPEQLNAIFYAAVALRSTETRMVVTIGQPTLTTKPEQTKLAQLVTSWAVKNKDANKSMVASVLSILCAAPDARWPMSELDPLHVLNVFDNRLQDFVRITAPALHSPGKVRTWKPTQPHNDMDDFAGDTFDLWLILVGGNWEALQVTDLEHADQIPLALLQCFLSDDLRWFWDVTKWIQFSKGGLPYIVQPFRDVGYLAFKVPIFFSCFFVLRREFPGDHWASFFHQLVKLHSFLGEQGMHEHDTEFMTELGLVIKNMAESVPEWHESLPALFYPWELSRMSAVCYSNRRTPLVGKSWVPNYCCQKLIPGHNTGLARQHIAVHQYFLESLQMKTYLQCGYPGSTDTGAGAGAGAGDVDGSVCPPTHVFAKELAAPPVVEYKAAMITCKYNTEPLFSKLKPWTIGVDTNQRLVIVHQEILSQGKGKKAKLAQKTLCHGRNVIHVGLIENQILDGADDNFHAPTEFGLSTAQWKTMHESIVVITDDGIVRLLPWRKMLAPSNIPQLTNLMKKCNFYDVLADLPDFMNALSVQYRGLCDETVANTLIAQFVRLFFSAKCPSGPRDDRIAKPYDYTYNLRN